MDFIILLYSIEMISLIYIIVFVLVIIYTFSFAILVSLEKTKTYDTLGSELTWCYPDWVCGDSTDNENMYSPVTDYIPLLYSCRLENFYVSPELNATCVCPVLFTVDRNVDLNPKSSTYLSFISPSEQPTYMYVCDNNFLHDPLALKDQSDKSTAGTVGICSPVECSTLWGSANFSDPARKVGALKSLTDLNITTDQKLWKVKRTRSDSTTYRSAPAVWDYNNIKNLKIPQYTSSIIYGKA